MSEENSANFVGSKKCRKDSTITSDKCAGRSCQNEEEMNIYCIASDVLTNVVIVLRKILNLLNARQLNACARVCRVWRDQVIWEKDNRKQLRWNCFTFDENCDCDVWKNTVQSYIESSPFDPSCILIFCTATLWAQVVEPKTAGRKRKKRGSISAKELILPSIPSKCVLQLTVTDGIVGTDEVDNKTKEMEDFSCSVSLLMIGNFPGVEFSSFALTHMEWVDLANYWTNSAKKPLCMKHLFDKDVKMFNLYCPMNGIDQEVCYALFKLFGWPLISGGFVNERSLKDSNGAFHSTHQSCIISGLSLSGNVRVASILLRSHIQLKDEVKRVIKSLTVYNFPLENSFALMYACVGRGQHLYNQENVEADIFREYFPDTPLLGFFGNGEIGSTFPQPGLMPVVQTPRADPDIVDGEDEMSPAQLKRHLAEMKVKLEEYRNKHVPKILHSYSTCICLIALP